MIGRSGHFISQNISKNELANNINDKNVFVSHSVHDIDDLNYSVNDINVFVNHFNFLIRNTNKYKLLPLPFKLFKFKLKFKFLTWTTNIICHDLNDFVNTKVNKKSKNR